jgi:hypothetical protein
MRRKKHMKITLLVGMVCLCSTVYSATIFYDFSTATGDLGASHVYSSSGVSITATAFPVGEAHLYGKAAGGDENGLGLTNDLSGDHEITFGSFIQLDISTLMAYNALTIKMGSTTGGEGWSIYQTNTNGTLSGASLLLSGSDELSHNVSPTKTFLDITAFKSGDNVLLGSMAAVPEPNSLALIGAVLGLVALVRRTTSYRRT